MMLRMITPDITLFGIANCDTVKKARAWLTAQGWAYQFHDFKKHGVPADRLAAWLADAGWEKLVNRQGTTWRKLTDEQKQAADSDVDNAIDLLIENTSMIKRPIVEGQLADKNNGQLILLCGFDAAEFDKIFS